MKYLASKNSQVLFRGQTAIYDSILPSLMRPNISDEDRRAWWRVTRRFISSRSGLTGFNIDSPHDALGIIQHYLLKSSVIDVTGEPKVALYFAIGKGDWKSERVVYAIEGDALRDAGFVVADHAFLALPLDSGGLRHRWLRQDGYTVGTQDWMTLDSAHLDFLRIPGLKRFVFSVEQTDCRLIEDLGDLETIDNDPLAWRVRSLFEAVAQGLGCLDDIRKLIPKETTGDAQGELARRIDAVIQKAIRQSAPQIDLEQLNNIKTMAKTVHWDTSWSVALELLEKRFP